MQSLPEAVRGYTDGIKAVVGTNTKHTCGLVIVLLYYVYHDCAHR